MLTKIVTVDEPDFSGVRKRCLSCGGLVYLPCFECEIAGIASRTSRREAAGTDAGLGMDLRVEDLRRYLLIREWVQAQAKRYGAHENWDDLPDLDATPP